MSEERLFQPGGGVIVHQGDGGDEAMHERSSLLFRGQSSESPLPAEAPDWILGFLTIPYSQHNETCAMPRLPLQMKPKVDRETLACLARQTERQARQATRGPRDKEAEKSNAREGSGAVWPPRDRGPSSR